MPKPLDLKNVTLETPAGGQWWSMSCEYDGARYHFWMDPGAPQRVASTYSRLYKNPLPKPDGTYLTSYEPGYFNTIKLDPARGLGKVMVPQMLAMVPDLLPAALAERDAKIAQERTTHERAVLKRRKEFAAEEMFALLKDIFAAEGTKLSPSLCNQGFELLRRVEKGE